MLIICVHGISDDRKPGWVERWRTSIRPNIFVPKVKFAGIEWESVHESRYDPSTSHRQNLLQDLGALTNPAVQHHIQTQLLFLINSDEPVWIVAHSLGSALAYQALESLHHAGAKVNVEKLVTVGSPLWIPFSKIVKRICCLNVVMPRAVKLPNVKQWVNIAGSLDPVSGFGIVKIPAADRHFIGWTRHSFDRYGKTLAFREGLRI